MGALPYPSELELARVRTWSVAGRQDRPMNEIARWFEAFLAQGGYRPPLRTHALTYRTDLAETGC